MKEQIMSAVEFGLTSQTPFVSPAVQPPFAHPAAGLELLAARYERLAQLSSLIAAMTPEILSRDLVGLFQPLFPCDLVNIVIFDQTASAVRWKSFGEEQLAQPDIPIEETTIWSVYQEQQALWIEDCRQDERLAVREEGENAVG